MKLHDFRIFVRSVLMLLIIAATAEIARSASVTLAFNAIVGSPRQGSDATVPPEWGITLNQGDVISGTLTFDPVDIASGVNSNAEVGASPLTLQIKTQSIVSTKYRIDSYNDQHPTDVAPYDEITFGCGLSDCNPTSVPAAPSLQLFMQGVLYGTTSVLDGADIPTDVSVWNQLTVDRELFVNMQNQTRFYGFLATIQSFSVQSVPEPPSAAFFAFAAMILNCSRASRLATSVRGFRTAHARSQFKPPRPNL
jgi:hypothetical protein